MLMLSAVVKTSNQLLKLWDTKICGVSYALVACIAPRRGSSHRNSISETIGPAKTFLLTSRLEIDFSYHVWVASFFMYFGNLGGKVPAGDVLPSHEQQLHSTTSLVKNRLKIESQIDRTFCVFLKQPNVTL